MTRPVVGSIAEEIYASLAAFAPGDETRGWALLHLTQAIGMQNQVVRDIVFEDDDGRPGWSSLFDIDRCPAWALDWLGQFVGVRIPPSLVDVEERRAWVRDAAGWRRGRMSTLAAAVRVTLTGARQVVTRARYNPADPSNDAAAHLQVKTYTTQTPDPTATERAAQAAKRGGLILHYAVVDGQDLLQLSQSYASLSAVNAAYTNLGLVADDIPI